MKSKSRNIAGILLIIAGITILLFAFKGKYETNKVQDELYNKFVNLDVSDKEIKSKTKEVTQNYVGIDAYINFVDPIAILEIPKINLKVVVAEGVEKDIIKYAVGHFEETVMPGELGNCALAGHRNFDTGEFFLKINKLKVDDEIKISTHENTFTYKVTESFTVAPEDTYVLDKSDEAIITLVTCTYDGKERLIVKGKLAK